MLGQKRDLCKERTCQLYAASYLTALWREDST